MSRLGRYQPKKEFHAVEKVEGLAYKEGSRTGKGHWGGIQQGRYLFLDRDGSWENGLHLASGCGGWTRAGAWEATWTVQGLIEESFLRKGDRWGKRKSELRTVTHERIWLPLRLIGYWEAAPRELSVELPRAGKPGWVGELSISTQHLWCRSGVR